MTIEEATQILKHHNKWRRDETGKLKLANPKLIGEAIDTVIQFIELYNKNK